MGDAIPAALTDIDANAATGRAIFVERERGHCVLCHAVDGLNSEFQGNVGPALTDIASRLSEGQIRLRIVDISRLHPDTVMPSYYRVTDLSQIPDALEGQPVLPAEDIEHLIAYLISLEDPDASDRGVQQ